MIWGGYFLLVGVVFVVGDYLYTAYLYTLIAPIVVLEICSWIQTRSLRDTGCDFLISGGVYG